MPTVRELSRSFAAGELAPELYGRLDLAKYPAGLALMRNFIALPHGPAMNRAGTEFVWETKTSAAVSRLIPFSYNNTQTFAIEVGAGYFRFHTQAAVLLAGSPTAWSGATNYVIGDLVSSGGANYYCISAHINHAPPNGTYWYAMPATGEYEIPNPYLAAELFDIHYVQSADVITLVHPLHPVQELRRYGATNWQLFAPTFSAPTNGLGTPTCVASPSSGSTPHQYIVTGLTTSNLEETVASTASTNVNNDLTVAGNKNTISWTDGTGLYIRYNVYSLASGLYGFIGTCSSLSFVDNNIIPDVSKTPPINDTGFNDGANNYPSAVSYIDQRRAFAATLAKPQNVWMTRSGTESNLSYSIPTRDDNRIAFRIAAREASAIRHIVPVADIILLTASNEWKLSSPTGVITPSSIALKPQSHVGASNVQPIIAGNVIIFAQGRGGHLRETAYNWQANGYLSNDISLLAPHLFEQNKVVDMAFAGAPYPIVWAVDSTGRLLGMTYVPEQQISAWHRHDTTNGKFESVCVIAETPPGETSPQDMVYTIVNRTIGGQTKRYVERMHSRYFATINDSFFVDSGATYNGAPTTTVSGLTWLEGQTVSILADGAVVPSAVVTGGAVHIPTSASKITVGVPLTADMQTLPLGAQIDAALGQGRVKNLDKVWFRVNRSSSIAAGPSFSNLVVYPQRTTEVYGSPPALVSDEISLVVPPSWSSGAQLCIRHSDPLPLTVTDLVMQVTLGG